MPLILTELYPPPEGYHWEYPEVYTDDEEYEPEYDGEYDDYEEEI